MFSIYNLTLYNVKNNQKHREMTEKNPIYMIFPFHISEFRLECLLQELKLSFWRMQHAKKELTKNGRGPSVTLLAQVVKVLS